VVVVDFRLPRFGGVSVPRASGVADLNESTEDSFSGGGRR
jgi:hypothetical protein